MKDNHVLTMKQRVLVGEFCDTYGLDPGQIGFEGDSEDPIFDYEALNVLRMKLTDIKDSNLEVVERTSELITVRCTLVLPDGRSAVDLGTSFLGEVMHDGVLLENVQEIQNVALARSFRRALRAAGVNLVKAHRRFLETGEPSSAIQDPELDSRLGRHIHALASDFGHISPKGREKYRNFIESIFGEGKRSSLDLSDIEKNQLVATYQAMLRQRRHAERKYGKSAA